MEKFFNALKKLAGTRERPKLPTEEEARQDRINANNADYEMGNYDSPLPENDSKIPTRELADETRKGPPEDRVE